MWIRTVFVILFALPLTMNGEKPYTFANTPGKLPKQVVPLEYSIRIVPDVSKFTFSGSETVKLKASAPVHELVLNSLELEIAKASIDGTQLSPAAIKLDPNNELLTVALPNELAIGEHSLALEFSGTITPKGRGIYYMPYQEQGTGAKKISLYTYIDPSDARRFFPCWDEPIFRARFQLTAVVPENWLAVSNMPVESERKIDPPSPNAGPARTSGATRIDKEVRFQPTPSMSSYLNVFVAGELDAIETKAAGTQIRVIATKGKAEWGRYALESTAHFNPDWEVWLARNIQRDPARRTGIAKEVAMEGDARSTTHAIQQPIANESDANSAFDDITYRKGQSFLRMLESFLSEDVFRDGVRRYIAAHQHSNSTTADLWNALSDASGKRVGEIAAAWTEQPGFPVVMMKRDGEKVSLSQERFTINFPNAPALQWKIPVTYFVVGEKKIENRLMTDKLENLPSVPTDRVIKLNANGAGN